MSNIKSTVWNIELNNGETVPLTLNFGALYRLRMKDKGLYDKYNECQRKDKKAFDELDMAVILYTAYICANIEKENPFTLEEFLEELPADREIVGQALTMLLAPSKKKADSQRRFREQQRK